jgi:hypothetical protein
MAGFHLFYRFRFSPQQPTSRLQYVCDFPSRIDQLWRANSGRTGWGRVGAGCRSEIVVSGGFGWANSATWGKPHLGLRKRAQKELVERLRKQGFKLQRIAVLLTTNVYGVAKKRDIAKEWADALGVTPNEFMQLIGKSRSAGSWSVHEVFVIPATPLASA